MFLPPHPQLEDISDVVNMFPSVSAIFPLPETKLIPELPNVLLPPQPLWLSLSTHVTLFPLILATTRPLLFKIVRVSLEWFPQLQLQLQLQLHLS